VNHILGVDPAELPQNQSRGTKAGEDGLDQVEARKARQEQPPRADLPSEHGPKEHHDTRKETNEGISFHDVMNIYE